MDYYCKAGSATRLLFLLLLLFAESFQSRQWLDDGRRQFEESPELRISKQNILAQVPNKRLLNTRSSFDLDHYYKELGTGDEATAAGGEYSSRRFKLKTRSFTVGIYEERRLTCYRLHLCMRVQPNRITLLES